MAKRLTDSNKWQDAWFMDLPSKYKLFWLYILDNCDHAGIWKVNFKVAAFHIGEHLEPAEVKRILSNRLKIINDEYWMVEKFIDFQYGGIKNDAVGKSVQKILISHNLIAPKKPLNSPYVGTKDKDKDKVETTNEVSTDEWLKWGNQIIAGNDAGWEAMRGPKISQAEMDQFISVAVRNKWKIETQQDFRYALKGFKPMDAPKEVKNRLKLQ